MIFLIVALSGKTINKRTPFVIANKVIQIVFWGSEAEPPLDFNFNSSRDFYLHNLTTRSLRTHFLQFMMLNSSVLLTTLCRYLFSTTFTFLGAFAGSVADSLFCPLEVSPTPTAFIIVASFLNKVYKTS